MLRYKDNRLKMISAGGGLSMGKQTKIGNIRVGLKFLFCLSLSMLAFGNRTTEMLLMLSGVNLLLMAVYAFGLRVIRKGAVLFLSQSVLIVALYLIRFGTGDVIWSGFKISWQLLLAFLPGLVF